MNGIISNFFLMLFNWHRNIFLEQIWSVILNRFLIHFFALTNSWFLEYLFYKKWWTNKPFECFNSLFLSLWNIRSWSGFPQIFIQIAIRFFLRFRLLKFELTTKNLGMHLITFFATEFLNRVCFLIKNIKFFNRLNLSLI